MLFGGDYARSVVSLLLFVSGTTTLLIYPVAWERYGYRFSLRALLVMFAAMGMLFASIALSLRIHILHSAP